MRNQSGVSSLLAAAASFLVVGFVAVGTPVQAGTEEDLAVPQGSFVSTMPIPNEIGAVVTVARDADNRPALILAASEEDAAVPQGSFTSTMLAPDIHDRGTRLAGLK